MNVFVQSHINKITVGEKADNIREAVSSIKKIYTTIQTEFPLPNKEVVKVASDINNIGLIVFYETNAKQEKISLETFINPINSDVLFSKARVISTKSHIKPVFSFANNMLDFRNIGFAKMFSNVAPGKITTNIIEYNFPITYLVLTSYQENQSNIYHIE